MPIKKKIFAISCLTLLLFSGIATSLLTKRSLHFQKQNNIQKTSENEFTHSTAPDTPESKESTDFKQMNDKLLQSQPKTKTSETQELTTEGTSSSFSGKWWNAEWEYRKNVTLNEPDIVKRKNWPVSISLTFSPKAHYRSLRVINSSSGKEIPSQPWNLTRTGDYISHATITFLANISKGKNRTYQVYWSADKVENYPGYNKKLSTSQGEDVYTIESLTSGYKIKTKRSAGAKAVNVTHLNGEKIQHEIAHFGITKSPSTAYEEYWGDGDTNRAPESFYFAHEGESFYSQYRGTIFARYYVKNITMLSGSTPIGRVNYTYTFYPSFWKVEESIEWTSPQVGADYYTSGWVFDQDNGGRARFSHVADSNTITDIREKKGGFIEPGFNLETGTVTTSTEGAGWTAVSFDSYFEDPIVVATGQEGNDTEKDPDGSDAERSRPIIRNVDSNGFEVRVLNDTQDLVKEKVGWMAVEKGHWTWYGVEIEAGNYTAKYNSETEYTVPFQESFPSSTVVVDMIQEDTAYPETSRYSSMTSTNYSVYWEDFDHDGYFSPSEANAGYIAIERGAISDLFESGIIDQCEADVDGSAGVYWDRVSFQNSYQQTPLLFGNPIGSDGGDPAVLGRSRLNKTGVSLRITEGTYTDSEQSHTDSDVPWFIVSPLVESSVPEAVDMCRNGTDWNKTAFYHAYGNDGIGMSFLSKNQQVDTVFSNNYTWYNEGNDSIHDYIYWARHLNITTSIGNTLSNKYAVIPWLPTGTTAKERLSQFNHTHKALQHPVNVTKDQLERFKLNVSIQIKDKNRRSMEGVEIHFRNETGFSLYSSVTDSNGKSTVVVNRSWYNITVTFTSAENTYQNHSIVSYNSSKYNYTLHQTAETILFPYLVHLRIYATDKAQTTAIQYGEVRLTNNTYTNSILTDEDGWTSFYLPNRTWNLRFNKTGSWDTFNLSYYSNDSLVEDNEGSTTTSSGNKSLTDVPIMEYQVWKLVDIDVTNPPNPSELYLKDIPTTLNPTWGKNVSGTMVLRNSENKTNLRGNISWYILNAENNVVISYKDVGYSPYTSNGVKDFTFNTSLLQASKSYTLKFNGSVNNTYYPSPHYQYPVPYTLNIFIDPAPISSFSVTPSPSRVIPWNTSLTITVKYKTSAPLTPGIQNATVNATLYHNQYSAFYELTSLNEPGKYQVTIEPFQHVGTGDYTFLFKADADNYSSIEKEEIFTVKPRSTTLETNASICIPWQEQYTFTAEFQDTTSQTIDISQANVTYSLIGTSVNGIMHYTNGRYMALINITEDLPSTGEYTIQTTAGKKNYENLTARTVFTVRKRHTYLKPNTTSVTTPYSTDVAVKFQFQDLDQSDVPYGSAYIEGASTSLNVEGIGKNLSITHDLTYLGEGWYLLNISSIKLGVENCTITVSLSKTHYESVTERIFVVIQDIPTSASITNQKPKVYWGQNVSLNLSYLNRLTDTPIPQATVLYTIAETGETGSIANTPIISWNEEAETYLFKYNSSRLPEIKAYTLKFTLTKAKMTTRTISITLRVKPLPSRVNNPEKVSVVWGSRLTFNFSLHVMDLDVLPEGVKHEITDLRSKNVWMNETDYSNSITSQGNGIYQFAISSLDINEGVLNFNLTKTNYSIPLFYVQVTIEPLASAVQISFIDLYEEVKINPVTFNINQEVKKVTLSIKEKYGHMLHDVNVSYWAEGSTFGKGYKIVDVDGAYTFTFTIDWSKAEPNTDYQLHARILSLSIDGTRTAIPTDEQPQIESSRTTHVDYLGGSNSLPIIDYTIPSIWFYTMIGTIVVIAMFSAIQLYNRLTTPPEVKEINKIIEQVKQDNFEYPPIEREEQFQKKVEETIE